MLCTYGAVARILRGMKMKKVFLFCVLVFGFTFSVFGQDRLGNFAQRGMATQEMQNEGLTARHSSLLLGTKVRVTSVTSFRVVEVTIVGRLPVSPDRIIDLSPQSALVLGIASGGEVLISLPPRPVAVPQKYALELIRE